MRLYICRHGKAEADCPSGRDADRQLTDRGIRQAAYLGRALAELDHPPTRVLASPAKRAQETASAIGSALSVTVETEDLLRVDRGASAILELVERLEASLDLSDGPTAPVIALVGHNPDLSTLASMLLFGSPGGVELRTGHCVGLNVAPISRGGTAGTLVGSGRGQVAYRLEE
ncbi:MAG: phosphoglycerate mutase family protein [Planctomycetota bacterium]